MHNTKCKVPNGPISAQRRFTSWCILEGGDNLIQGHEDGCLHQLTMIILSPSGYLWNYFNNHIE